MRKCVVMTVQKVDFDFLMNPGIHNLYTSHNTDHIVVSLCQSVARQLVKPFKPIFAYMYVKVYKIC